MVINTSENQKYASHSHQLSFGRRSQNGSGKITSVPAIPTRQSFPRPRAQHQQRRSLVFFYYSLFYFLLFPVLVSVLLPSDGRGTINSPGPPLVLISPPGHLDSVVSIYLGRPGCHVFDFKLFLLPSSGRLQESLYLATCSTHRCGLNTMDLANLISQPGHQPAMTVKARHDPPAFEPGTFYSTSFARTQAPLSPPVEDKPRCSLPSISSLLDSADGAASQPASKLTPS